MAELATIAATDRFPHYRASVMGQEVLAQLKPYFDISEQKSIFVAPHEMTNYSHQDLPFNFLGQSTLMEERITDFVVHEGNRWYTTVGLPWRLTNQIHHKISSFHFNVIFPGRVPHESVSRLTSSYRKHRTAHSKRFGLGLILENDFFMTPAGKEEYANQLRGIACCVQEGANHDVMVALLTCRTREMEWQAQHTTMPFRFKQLIDMETSTYCAVPKDRDRLSVLIEQHKKVLTKNKVTPDTIILCQGASIYLTMATGKPTEYQIIGPEGRIEFNKGPDALGSVQGLNVYETDTFDLYTDAPPVDLLTRTSVFGEWNVMSFKPFRTMSDLRGRYETRWRDIYEYSSNSDHYEKIPFPKAFRNCGIFAKNDNQRGYSDEAKKVLSTFEKGGKNLKPRRYVNEKKNEDDDSLYRKVKSGEEFKPFWIVEDVDGKFTLAEIFGEFALTDVTTRDFEHMAQTVLSRFSMDFSTALMDYNDGKRLLEDIEGEGYDHAYWEALIRANESASIAQGNFIGQETPQIIADMWGTKVITEWMHNAVGSMDLPTDIPNAICKYPSGFANAPGLRSLRDHAVLPNSKWYEVGKRADKFIRVLDALSDCLCSVIPESYFLTVQRPWFHVINPLTALFNECISVPRDPIFLAELPHTGQGSASANNNSPYSGQDIKAYWAMVTYDPSRGSSSTAVKAELQRLLQNPTAVVTPSNPTDLIYSRGPSNMILPASTLQNSAFLAPELKAYLSLGTASFEAYHSLKANIMAIIDPEVRREALNNLVGVISYYGGRAQDMSKMRGAIIRLEQIRSTSTNGINEVLPLLKTLHYNPATGARSDRSASSNLLASLAQDSKVDNDPDAFTDARLKNGLLSAVKITRSTVPTSGEKIGDDMEALFNAVNAVDKNRIEVKKISFPLFDLSQDPDAAPDGSWWKVDADATLLAKAKTAALKVRADFTAAGVDITKVTGPSGLDSITRSRTTGDAGSVPVSYHRAPLTMSMGLLESLAKFVGVPLILPGDDQADFLEPVQTTDSDIIPKHLYMRPNYAPIDATVGPAKLFRGRDLHQSAFVQMHKPFDTQMGDAGAPDVDSTSYKRGYSSLSSSSSSSYGDDGRPYKQSALSSREQDDGENYTGGFSRYNAPLIGARGLRNREPRNHGEFPKDDWSRGAQHTRDAPGERIKRSILRGTNSEALEKYKKFTSPTIVERWIAAQRVSDPIYRVVVMALIVAPCNELDYWMTLINNDVHVPVNILLFRPEISYDMSTFVIFLAGAATGASFYGHSYFDLGQDVATKMYLGNFTWYSTAFVYNEKNVTQIPHVFPNKYNGGSNTGFIEDKTDFHHGAEKEGVDRNSIVAAAVPINEESFAEIMSITGTIPLPDANESIDKGIRKKSYSTYRLTEERFDIGAAYANHNPMKERYLEAVDKPNIICLPGLQVNFSPSKGVYSDMIVGTGHRAPNAVGPGTAKIWNGENKYFPPLDTHVELP